MNPTNDTPGGPAPSEFDDGPEFSLLDLGVLLAENLRLLILGPLAVGLAALGISFSIAPTFTAKTVILPPQQQQSSAAAALQSLGALAGLAGAAGMAKSPADQYVALMQSAGVLDRLVDEFDLMTVYDTKYRVDARRELLKHSRISVGKKDGLLQIEVDDKDPARAAAIANAYVEQLRRLTSELALTEAQQRRAFFEKQLQQTNRRLTEAQQALQASGFTEGALRAEPRATAEAYARLRAETTAAEVRLQSLRSYLTDSAAELQQAQATLVALRAQLTKAEAANTNTAGGGGDYINRYREFKYQETLFELFAKQFELARVDESREGALIQVVDRAAPPEHKSKPKRGNIAVVATLLAAVLLLGWVVARLAWRRASEDQASAEKLARIRASLRWR